MIDVTVTPLLLNWRKLVCSSGLKGLLREIAAGSEVLELSDAEVVLRPLSHSLIDHDVISQIAKAVSRVTGHAMEVRFTEETRSATAATVSLLEESERRAARIAMIDAFRSDPFVQKCVELFNGTLDETSVRAMTTQELEELQDYARKHSRTTGSGSEDAEKC